MSLTTQTRADRVVVLVGNPALGSRTSAVARTVAEGVAHGRPVEVVELAAVGAAGIAADAPAALAARELVSSASTVVVATPVYKAGITGLLKLFLDGFDLTALDGTPVVPVVVAGSGAHGVLADLQLRVVLHALGALVPVPTFVVEEHHLDHLGQYVDAWRRRFGPVLTALTGALRQEEVLPA